MVFQFQVVDDEEILYAIAHLEITRRCLCQLKLNHILVPTVAIQGNLLVGSPVLGKILIAIDVHKASEVLDSCGGLCC